MLTDWLVEHYNWIEACHIVAVISWMAGMLYLPRLYVYHADVVANSETYSLLRIMERRLTFFIMTPAAVIAVLLGIVLAVVSRAYLLTWFHVKSLLILMMLIIHGCLIVHGYRFANCRNTRSSLYFKVLNETITILMIIIVIIATVKPFQ